MVENIPVLSFRRLPVDPTELRLAAEQGEGTAFFQKFNFGFLVQNRQPLFAYNEIFRVLGECREADMLAFKRLHKGGPYYWLGMSAFMMRDFETATFFMDAAVEEDLRKDSTSTDTPAMLFMSLRGDHPSQAAKELVASAEEFLAAFIATYLKYRHSATQPLTFSMQDLRSQFLLRAISPSNRTLRSSATALISFILESNLRKLQLDNVLDPASFEPYVFHLFKGGLLLESLIRLNPKNPPSGRTLRNVLAHVSGDLRLPSDLNISADELQDVIDQATTAEWTIQNAFQIAGRVRNTTGHSLGWQVKFTFDQYGATVQHLAVACIHTISVLYRTPF